MKQHALDVVWVEPDKIQQHPENPNNGDVDAIEESIAVNGLYGPVTVQRSTGNILRGNHTYLAAIRRGFPKVPVIYLNVDDEEAQRILLVDNEAARKGVVDEAQLYNLLDSLRGTTQGLAGTGFDYRDLEYLHQLVAEPLTAADLGVTTPGDGGSEFSGTVRGRRLDLNMVPDIDDDGVCETIVLSRHEFRAFTAVDFNAIRVAFGMKPLTRAELAETGVKGWGTA